MGAVELNTRSKAHVLVIVTKNNDKERHTISEGFKLFPIHTWLYFIYIILIFVLALFGTLLSICGSWANTGVFTLNTVINSPWPNLEVEDLDDHFVALELLQMTCWISGFFFWFFALYLVYVVYIFYGLLLSKRPWDRQTWHRVRLDANQVLELSKVREETIKEQFGRMNEKQQQEMEKFKRNVVDPTKVTYA